MWGYILKSRDNNPEQVAFEKKRSSSGEIQSTQAVCKHAHCCIMSVEGDTEGTLEHNKSLLKRALLAATCLQQAEEGSQ